MDQKDIPAIHNTTFNIMTPDMAAQRAILFEGPKSAYKKKNSTLNNFCIKK